MSIPNRIILTFMQSYIKKITEKYPNYPVRK